MRMKFWPHWQSFIDVSMRSLICLEKRGKMYIVDSKRIATMRLRLGKASDLIDNDAYLPMFRNRQKQHQNEFEHSVKIAKQKNIPARFFAKIWSTSNLKQTLEWMRAALNRLAADLARSRQALAEAEREQRYKQEYNEAGRKRYLNLCRAYNLFGSSKAFSFC